MADPTYPALAAHLDAATPSVHTSDQLVNMSSATGGTVTAALNHIHNTRPSADNTLTAGAVLVGAGDGHLEASATQLSTVTGHIASTANPHGVTKAQVGLGDCDNTSDADKPISTATATALAGKETAGAAAAAQAFAVQRGNHTGTQTLATISDAGTAAAKNAPAAGNAAAAEVVLGNDTRLTDPRAPTAHTHALSDLTQSGATTGQVPKWNGSVWAPGEAGGITVGTAIPTTSGTSHTFTALPAGIKRITVMLQGVSTSGASPVQLQLGTSGGIEATGYAGSVSITGSGSTSALWGGTGVQLDFSNVNVTAASVRSGRVTFTRISGNTWVADGLQGQSNVLLTVATAGSKTLSGELTQLRLTTVNGTDTFDAGSINIMWE